MLNKAKQIFALLLAVVLVFSMVGCNKKVEEESSGGIEYVVEEEVVYEDGTTGTTTGGTSQTGGPSGGDSGDIDYSQYKGTKVVFATTIDPKNDEGGPVVESFKKKYGIDVEIALVGNGDYANEITGLIASDKAPDFVRVSANFPSCMSYLQPLECTKLDFSDKMWNQAVLNVSTFNGKPYFADTVNGIWTECDIIVYSKSMLKKAGARTPEEYDKAGKWTWDAFFEISRKVTNVVGSTDQTAGGGFITRESAIYGMGGGLIQLKDGKFVNGVNSRTQEAMTKFTQAWKEGIISWSTTDGIVSGKVGITTCHIWMLKKTSDWKAGVNYGDLGYYYLPRWDANSDYGNTGMVRGWGIAKGAKNPVAAGAFMKHYLDVGNYDLNCFISDDAKEFFFRATSKLNSSSWNPSILYPYDQTQEAISGINASTNGYYMAMSGDPAQIGSVMGSVKGAMDKAAKNLNAFVQQQTTQN